MNDNLAPNEFISGGRGQWISALEKEVERLEAQLEDPANAEKSAELQEALIEARAELQRAQQDSGHTLFFS